MDPLIDTVDTTSPHCDVDTEMDRSTHDKNYYLLILFHADLDKRPCRPVLQVVHLNRRPETTSPNIHENPQGVEIVTTCQLCDPLTNSTCPFRVDLKSILCICAVNVTDSEAFALITNVSKINTHTTKQITLSERSNLALAPMWMHKYVKSTSYSISNIEEMSYATDVQLAIMLIRESIDKSRSLWSKTNALHSFLTTPENLYDYISIFTRNIDIQYFKINAFKFISV